MSGLSSIAKRIRKLGPDERHNLDMRIEREVYGQSRSEIAAARKRLDDDKWSKVRLGGK